MTTLVLIPYAILALAISILVRKTRQRFERLEQEIDTLKHSVDAAHERLDNQ